MEATGIEVGGGAAGYESNETKYIHTLRPVIHLK
jgi:hypothetical protein